MASPSTSPLASSEGKSNGVKLHRLLIDGGTSALRRVFDGFHPPSRLASVLSLQRQFLEYLYQIKVLNGPQRALLFPRDGGRPDSSTFDISLLFILLTNICGLSPPPEGWHTKPPSSDTSREANIVRIKYYRNLLSHPTSTEVSTRNFEIYWQEIADALVAFGEDRNAIDALKIHPLNKLTRFDFTAEIEYHAGGDRFQIGTRDWVFNSVEDWLDNRRSRHQAMIITGDAGMGKSVIAAVICKRMQEAGRLLGSHFCQYNSYRYRNPKLMLQSLAFQLSCSLPEYKEALVKQLSRNVGEELDNLGVVDLFGLLFKEPLSSVADPGRNILMVIDGLDETEFQGQNELLDVITNHLCRLPFWIRSLVTTRPARNILDQLRSLNPLELKEDDEKNRKDVEIVFERRICDSITQEERPTIVRELVQLSEGLMLYAFFLIDLIKRSTSPPTPEKLRSSFPQGIARFYTSNFGEMEAKLREELANNYGNFLSYFLCALTAAKAPLPKDFVIEILKQHTNISANDRLSVQRKIDSVISCISSLLPIRQGHVHIFHKSVRDWLTDSSRYGNDEKEGHKILSQLCTAELDELKTSCVNDAPFSNPQKYALRHGFQHMLEAMEDSSQLEGLVKGYVTDLELVYAKLCVKNADVLKDMLLAQEHRNSSALSEEIKNTLKSLQLQFKKHGSLLRDLPQMIFQNLLIEGGSVLAREVSNFLLTKHHEMSYLELVNKNEQQSPVEARFYCSDKVVCFDVSPDGEYMVCECRDGTIHLWSLQTGELEWQNNLLGSKKLYDNVPLGTAFRGIATNDDTGSRTLSLYRSVVFHPDGQLILPGNLTSVYNLGGHLQLHFRTSKCHFTVCAFSGDKNKMLTDNPENRKEVVMWNVQNGEEIKRHESKENIASFAMSQDGNLVAISDSKGSVRVYNSIWQQVAEDIPAEATVCGLVHFTTKGGLVCGSIVSTRSDGRDVYKLLTFVSDSTLVANRQSHWSCTCKVYLWPWESVDSVDRLQVVCKVCHFVSADLLVGFCSLLPGELAVVGGPTAYYLTMLNVASPYNAGERPRTVEAAFSSDIAAARVYTTITNCSPKDPLDKPCLVTLSVRDKDSVRDVKGQQSFQHTTRRVRNGLLSSPVERGVLVQSDSTTLELWNSDLSECIPEPLTMSGEVERLISVSKDLVGCVLNAPSSEGGHSLTFSMLDVSLWKVVFERVLKGRAEMKSVACSIYRDVVFCSEQDASEKRRMVLYKGDAEMCTWERNDAIYQGGCSWRHPHCVFSPKGEVVVTWNTLNDGYGLHVLQKETGRRNHIFLENCYDIADCKFLNDGNSVVCFRYDCNVRVFSVISGEVLAVMDIGERPTCIGSSLSEPLIAVGLRFSSVILIRAKLPRRRRADVKRTRGE